MQSVLALILNETTEQRDAEGVTWRVGWVGMFLPQIWRITRRFLGSLNQAVGVSAVAEIQRQSGGGGGDEHAFKFQPLGSATKGLLVQPHPSEANHHSIKIKRHQLFTVLCNFILTKL
jgi:hypothetical protein